MGPLYEWLSTLDAATRAREVVYLVRLGAEVHLGAKAVRLAGPAEAVAPTGVADEPDMGAWNLDVMCVPPRKKST